MLKGSDRYKNQMRFYSNQMLGGETMNVYIIRKNGNIKGVFSNAEMAARTASSTFMNINPVFHPTKWTETWQKIARNTKRYGDWHSFEYDVTVTKEPVIGR